MFASPIFIMIRVVRGGEGSEGGAWVSGGFFFQVLDGWIER
jgi:hypothetical protein